MLMNGFVAEVARLADQKGLDPCRQRGFVFIGRWANLNNPSACDDDGWNLGRLARVRRISADRRVGRTWSAFVRSARAGRCVRTLRHMRFSIQRRPPVSPWPPGLAPAATPVSL